MWVSSVQEAKASQVFYCKFLGSSKGNVICNNVGMTAIEMYRKLVVSRFYVGGGRNMD